MLGWTVDNAPMIAIGLGLAWLAGLRVYLTVTGLGLAGAMGWIALPVALQVIVSPWVIGACALLALAEFVVDKIPGLDSGWDLLHTFVRIPVGACLGSAMLSVDHRIGGSSLLVGAVVALSSHAIKTAGRRAINTSPEPLSNWSASLSEDLLSALALIALFARPWLGLGLAVGGQSLVALATAISFRPGARAGSHRRMEATA